MEEFVYQIHFWRFLLKEKSIETNQKMIINSIFFIEIKKKMLLTVFYCHRVNPVMKAVLDSPEFQVLLVYLVEMVKE